jgi:hypothetical protein
MLSVRYEPTIPVIRLVADVQVPHGHQELDAFGSYLGHLLFLIKTVTQKSKTVRAIWSRVLHPLIITY